MKIRFIELERELAISRASASRIEESKHLSWNKWRHWRKKTPCWKNSWAHQKEPQPQQQLQKNDTTDPPTPVLPTPSNLWTRSCDSTPKRQTLLRARLKSSQPQSHRLKPQNTRSSAEFFHIRCSSSKVATKDHRHSTKNASSNWFPAPPRPPPDLPHWRYTPSGFWLQSRRTH